jgi:hypothetical protein
MRELSFSRARDSAFFVLYPATTICEFHKRIQLFMNAHDEPLSLAMRDLLALSTVLENGYD